MTQDKSKRVILGGNSETHIITVKRLKLITLFLITFFTIYWVFWEMLIDIPSWPSTNVWTWAIPIFVFVPMFYVCVFILSLVWIYEEKKWTNLLIFFTVALAFIHVWWKFNGDYRDFLWVKIYYLLCLILLFWLLVMPFFLKGLTWTAPPSMDTKSGDESIEDAQHLAPKEPGGKR